MHNDADTNVGAAVAQAASHVFPPVTDTGIVKDKVCAEVANELA